MAPFPRLKVFHLGEDIPGLLEVAEQTKKGNRQFRDKMRNAYSTHIAPLAQPVIANNEIPSFEQHFEETAIEFVRLISESSGHLTMAESRGFDGLLNVPSVNSVVGAHLSIVYANTYLGRLQNQGDSRDVQHVQLATTVGTLVTEDSNLIKVVRRMNNPHVKAVRLETLLQEL